MPKTGTLVVRTRHMHCVPAPLALRGFGPGFDSSRAQNPDPQRLRRRFFMPKNRSSFCEHAPVICTTCPLRLRLVQKRGHKQPQMCFLLLFPFGACVLRKSVVKFYSLPAQCVENIAGGFA